MSGRGQRDMRSDMYRTVKMQIGRSDLPESCSVNAGSALRRPNGGYVPTKILVIALCKRRERDTPSKGRASDEWG